MPRDSVSTGLGVTLVRSSVTCFIGGDGELVARVAVANDVLGDHADVVSGRRVEVNDSGLVELRRHIFGYLG